MAKPAADEIAANITEQLAITRLACSTLTPLTGGTANFIFKGQLLKPLNDGTAEVVIKHGEGYSASHTGLQLSTDRCVSVTKKLRVGLTSRLLTNDRLWSTTASRQHNVALHQS